MAHLVLGEMATLVLSSYRADPVQAKSLGFRFNYPTLDAALAEIYGTAAAKSGDATPAWR
jgi:NAD dependent epimerase/dehydratase family enzyme